MKLSTMGIVWSGWLYIVIQESFNYDHDYCNCAQFCIRPNTSLEMELHLGRISFCTVEVREGVVRRGCGFDPVEFPEVWWPDCTFTNWDHLNSQCKCYGQMCNDKFFYRNLNLGDEIIGKLSKFLPTPRSIPTTLTNPPEGVILCHLCDIEAKGALAESCYRPPTKVSKM